MSFAHRSVRRRQAEVYGLLFLTGWAAIACTSLLDIDGEYTIHTETGGAESVGSSGGGGGATPFGYGGSAWSGSSGGSESDAGSGSGGTLVVGTGGISAAIGGYGAEPGTGGVPSQTGGVTSGTGGILDIPDAGGPECTTGKFAGTFDGMHAPSITVVGVPLPVVGAVTFQLIEGAHPHQLKVAEALFNGEFNIIRGAPGVPFTATMVGDYDCATKALSGELVGGKFADPDSPTTFVTFSGTFSAKFGTQFTGTWQEVESTSSQFKGDGTFTARRVLR